MGNHRIGAQGTVCSGGRYDGLVEQLGGKATPAVGFSVGMERILLLVQQKNSLTFDTSVDIFIITQSDAAYSEGLKIAQTLRKKYPNFIVVLNAGGGNFKNQFKKANKANAKFALIIGDEELQHKQYSIKNLQEDLPQVSLEEEKLLNYF